MFTDNLEEMIKNESDVIPETMMAPEETDINSEEYFINEKKTSDPDGELTELKQIDTASDKLNLPVPYLDNTIVNSNFQAKTEKDLINHTKFLCHRLECSIVLTYWLIGQSINSFYQKKYGSSELSRIAEETGMNRDTITKSCKFAKKYTDDQIDILLNGRLTLAWNHITRNLSVKPEDLIEAYENSENLEQFNYDIIKFKSPNETRGRKAIASREDHQNPIQTDDATIDAKESIGHDGGSNIADEPSQNEDIVTAAEFEVIENETTETKQTIDEPESLKIPDKVRSNLQDEVERVKLELEEKNRQIATLEDIRNEMIKANIEWENAMFEVKEGMGELIELIENRTELDEVVDKINEIMKIASEILPRR